MEAKVLSQTLGRQRLFEKPEITLWSSFLMGQLNYRKNAKHLNTRKIAVIILKLEQYCFTLE